MLTFLLKNRKLKLSGESILSNLSNLVLVVVLVLESKGLYYYFNVNIN